MDYYTQIASATRVNREDVKRVVHAMGYAGLTPHCIEVGAEDREIKLTPEHDNKIVLYYYSNKNKRTVIITVDEFITLIENGIPGLKE